MTESTIEKLTKEFGAEIKTVKFGYWDCQAIVKEDIKLFLAMSVKFENGGESAITNIAKLPKKITINNIKKLWLELLNGNEYANNLGQCIVSKNNIKRYYLN